MTRLQPQSESESTESLPENDLRHSLNISSLEHTFDKFVSAPCLNKIYSAFRQFAEKLTPPLLLCYGGIGNGKTYLLEATAIRLKERGIFARVSGWSRFTALLKNALRSKDAMPSYEQILINFCQAPVLLMDDYGMGTTDTAWEKSVLEELVNFRYANRRPTALTSNMKLEDLPGRVVSRFSEPSVGIIIKNSGGDYRRKGE